MDLSASGTVSPDSEESRIFDEFTFVLPHSHRIERCHESAESLPVLIPCDCGLARAGVAAGWGNAAFAEKEGEREQSWFLLK